MFINIFFIYTFCKLNVYKLKKKYVFALIKNLINNNHHKK